jgi:hypothetical protein
VSAYECVLKTYPSITGSPLTFIEYLQLQKYDQTPIDALVKERTVARLIVKNSLNDRLRDHLITAFSTGDDCYPSTISDALSLLSTFVKAKKDTKAEDAVVSYHEAAHEVDIADDDDDTCAVSDTEANDMNDLVYDCVKEDDIESDADEHGNHVQFSTSVMATVIAEAAADAEEDQCIGASFAQLQDVEDVYEDDEPDIVCYAHIVDTSDVLDFDGRDEPEFVTTANTNAEEHNEKIREHVVTMSSCPHSDDIKDFELMIYHTAQRVLKKVSQNVGIYHYVPGRPDLITPTYDRNIPESIIDYSDALRFKFKHTGIHYTTILMSILSKRTDIDVMAELKRKFNAVGLKGINTSTVKILREETIRSHAHRQWNSNQYHTMEFEIGEDATMETFPRANTLLHHVVSSVAIDQNRRNHNRWVNKITLTN